MLSFTDQASDSDGDAKKVRTTGGGPNYFIRLNGVFIIQDKTGRNADIIYENVQVLCEITDFKWLGVEDESEGHIANLACTNHKMKKSFIESVVHEVYCAEMQKVEREMLKEDCTKEFKKALQEVYITKVEALELLHLQLGHLPYQRIEHMLQLGVLTGINLDKKLLHQLVRQKCDICIRAIATDSAHTGSLPVPDETWQRFSTDLSAKFSTMSIHGNYYQMSIIDVKTKYVWVYDLEMKDQVFEMI
jgi:hypothetical protein